MGDGELERRGISFEENLEATTTLCLRKPFNKRNEVCIGGGIGVT